MSRDADSQHSEVFRPVQDATTGLSAGNRSPREAPGPPTASEGSTRAARETARHARPAAGWADPHAHDPGTPDIEAQIQECEQLRRALESSEARFRNIIEKSADGVVVVSRDGCIAYVNPTGVALLRRPAVDLVGTLFGIPVVPGETTELDIPCSEGREQLVAEMRVVDTEWEGQPAFLATLRDVTERKRNEEALRSAEERFRRISEVTSDFSYSFRVGPDHSLELEWLTEAFTRLTGYTVAEVRNEGWERLVHPEDLHAVRSHFERVLAGGSDVCERRILTRGGSVRWIRHAARPVRHGGLGRIIRICGAGQDVTERRRLEDELRRRVDELADADRRKDEFLAMLAHELRNPLAPIRNAVHLLRRTDDPALRHEMRDLIDHQVSVLARLLDDLLDVSRITSGKVTLRRELIDLGSVVRRAAEMTRHLVEERGLTFHVELAQVPLLIMADPVRLQQVVSNLLHNAVKYTDPGGSIRVATMRRNREAALEVSDTGIGIDAPMLGRIFELFTQVDHSLDRSRGGLGIGLTLARQLVQMHGGRLEASSPGLGQGSLFCVAIPEARPEAVTALPRPSLADPCLAEPPVNRKVLVVDDNIDAARSLSMLVGLWGHKALVAHDGPEAIEIASREQPDIVLLDIGLPQMDGYEVAHRLRNTPGLADVVLIAMTGYGQEDDRRRARSSGFDHHMVKPLDLAGLEHLLRYPSRMRETDPEDHSSTEPST